MRAPPFTRRESGRRALLGQTAQDRRNSLLPLCTAYNHLPAMTDDGDGMDEISQLLNNYASLQAAHQSLLERYESHSAESNAEAYQEIDKLQAKVKGLQDELDRVNGEKEELSATVRDLRVRVEESRRAIMRLQGGGGTTGQGAGVSAGTTAGGGTLGLSGAHNGSSSGSSTAGSGAAAHVNRRSMGPAALASWNPREVAGSFAPAVSANATEQSYTHHTPEEAAELKKSKRASLAFGPNAQGTVGRRAHGHRRIASGSRIGVSDEDSQGGSMAPPSSSGQGLRELHLGGVPAANGSSSKRSSIYAAAANLFSPASDTSDLPPEETPDRGTAGSLLMPAKSIRRTSNSSSLSGSAREDLEGHLGIPGGTRCSVSPSPSSMTSPIMEAEESSIGSRWSNGRLGDDDQPWTARPAPNTGMSTMTGTFSAMQQQHSDQHYLQRQLAEQKVRVQDRDARLEEMRRDMHALKLELDEAREARVASESCLKALRDFVKDEGGRSTDADGGAQMLKGVKLPPLPTDKDTDDISSDSAFVPSTPARLAQQADVNTPTQATAAGSWRSLGNSFAGLSKVRSHTSEESGSSKVETSGGGTTAQPPGTPLGPSANIGSSIGTLWSRATAGTKRDSASVSSTLPSETATVRSSDSRHTSMTSASAESTAAFKGFAWFNKRTTSDENPSDAANAAPAPSTRVSSPPFANLDNHVLTLDQIHSKVPPGARKASVASSSASKDDMHSLEPNDRVRKAREKSVAVDEDTGFVPPTF